MGVKLQKKKNKTKKRKRSKSQIGFTLNGNMMDIQVVLRSPNSETKTSIDISIDG